MHANPRSFQKMRCCVQCVIVPVRHVALSKTSDRNTERHTNSSGALAGPHVQYCLEVMDEHALLSSLCPTHVRFVGSESSNGRSTAIV